MKRSHLLAAALMVVVGGLWVRGFWFTDVFRTHSSNEPNRAALLRVFGAIGVGSSAADVLTVSWQHRSEDLRLAADNSAAWFITMPTEFGASDWTLHVVFKDAKVTSVRIRTSDGPRPNDGPDDKTE